MSKLLICLFFFLNIFSKTGSQKLTCPLPPVPKDIICLEPIKKGVFVIKNLVLDFGADPTGQSNSQNAFECATNFFNKNGGNGKLKIPFGKYLVGNQNFISPSDNTCPFWTDYGWVGRDLMHFTDCKNLEIIGMADAKTKRLPILKFVDGLRIGGFRKDGSPSIYNTYDKGDSRYLLPQNCKDALSFDTYQSNIGTVIFFDFCNNIKVSNIEIDGNSSKYILGSYVGTGPKPYENWSHGVVIWNSSNICLLKMIIHDIGCDGILVKNFTDSGINTLSQNILMDSLIITKSGRNNVSWVGGNGLIIKNSQLSFASTGTIKTNPGSSIDIEPELHEQKANRCDYVMRNNKLVIINDYCFNGLLSNLNIFNDRLTGLLNADISNRTNIIKVNKCSIACSTGLSYYSVNKNNLEINNCIFVGKWNIGKIDTIKINKDMHITKTKFKLH